MLPDKPKAADEAKRPLRILRLRAVKEQTGLGTSTIYLKMTRGEFPRAVPLGEAAVGWLAHEIDAWIANRIAARDARAA
jgi:prophage regulatory protein